MRKMTAKEYERRVRILRSEAKFVDKQIRKIETKFGKIWLYAQKHIIPQIQERVFKMLGTKDVGFVFDYDQIFITPMGNCHYIVTKETWGFMKIMEKDFGIKINWGGRIE